MTIVRREINGGFTIVEMLVSLAVVGMAAVILLIGIGRISFALGASTQADRRLDQIADAQFVLRHRIETVFPARDVQTLDTVDFAGQSKSLDFLAAQPDRGGPDALHRYRLRIARDGTLTLYNLNSLTTAVDVHRQATIGWQSTPLVSGVADLAIDYFGPRADASGSAWQASWIHRLTLPVLVRVRVDLAAAQAGAWPELIIHPRAANGDTCERDVVTNLCKGAI